MARPTSTGVARKTSPAVDRPARAAEAGGVDTTGSPLPTMEEAILSAVVYADLFDYPLTLEEIHRYLTGRPASLEAVEEHLTGGGTLDGRLQCERIFWFLPGRQHLVALRHERQAFSSALWPKARRFLRLMASVPFVRMIAVTGSLAMDSATSAHDDVDLLIVAARNRVWLARGLVTLLVHVGRRFGVEFCPNYVIAENRLQLGEPSLFAAHELAQMVPVSGLETYRRLLSDNAWLAGFLPNATPAAQDGREIGRVGHLGKRLLEALLHGRAGDAIERRERKRKIPKLRRIAEERGAANTSYTPDLCKGHADDHEAQVRWLFIERLSEQGIAADRMWVLV